MASLMLVGIPAAGWAQPLGPAWAVPPLPGTPSTAITLPTTDGRLLSKAAPDECFDGVGVDYPAGPPCTAPARPKVNQAYVWGLAKSGDNLWFGTMANTQCLVEGAYLGLTSLTQTASAVCEFGNSQAVRLGVNDLPPLAAGALPAKIGDFRPPHIYVYNVATQAVVEKAVGPAKAALNTTLGLRAAGAIGDVVFLAGPSMSSGLNMFAFQASTGNFIGFKNFSAYSNIRKFGVIGGVLYAGVGGTSDALGEKTGRVLRWAGNLSSPPAFPNLFNFVEIGITDSMVSEIAEHEGRIFVTTWPDVEGGSPANPKIAGLFMSPTIPVGGLTTPAAEWTKVWSVGDYEPDPVTAMTYGGGALASFGGYLYWGTMHVPVVSTMAHLKAYPDSAPGSLTSDVSWLLQSERAISIFRGKNFAATPLREVLYGYTAMPTCVPTSATTCNWQTLPNKMSAPKWGGAGFDNPFNNYTWTMAVYDNRLWVGTMDWSWLLADGLTGLGTTAVSAAALPTLPAGVRGADLWYFPGVNSPAYPESVTGVGNASSYGIRTMVATDTDLFLGMANPMNLLTDPAAGPVGGWELIDLQAKEANTPAGSNVMVQLDGGNWVRFCGVSAAGFTLSNAISTDFLPGILAAYTGMQLRQVLLLGSTADWRDAAPCPGGLTRVFVRQAELPSGSRLMELAWDPQQGRLVWRDITLSQSADGLTGLLDAQFRGVLVVMAPIPPVPSLTAWGLAALALLLALGGAGALRSRAVRVGH